MYLASLLNTFLLTSLCLMLFLMQPSAIENGPYDYTRSGNPTRDALERFDHDVIGLCFVLQLWMFHIMFFCLSSFNLHVLCSQFTSKA